MEDGSGLVLHHRRNALHKIVQISATALLHDNVEALVVPQTRRARTPRWDGPTRAGAPTYSLRTHHPSGNTQKTPKSSLRGGGWALLTPHPPSSPLVQRCETAECLVVRQCPTGLPCVFFLISFVPLVIVYPGSSESLSFGVVLRDKGPNVPGNAPPRSEEFLLLLEAVLGD